MNLSRWIPGLAVGGLVALGASAGCVDLSPLDFEAPEAGAPDGGRDASGDGPSRDALAAECQGCLSGGECGATWTACEANTRCAAFATCMSTTLCWASMLTDLADLSPCLIQCAELGGITSQNDPAAVLVTPLYTCAQNPSECGQACVPGADF
jgi:hypothetical protein